MQAVILAAGMGTRIRDQHELPKGFIELNNEPIIKTSINKLKAAGISDILIVTGYRKSYYEEFAKEEGVKTLFNPHYHDRGSLYSLYCARHWIKESVLILESDLFYEFKALEKITKDQRENIILLSGKTNSGDEVYVETDKDRLFNMSKKRESLDERHITGEFVGVNKLSASSFRELVRLLDKNEKLLQRGNYEEDGFVALAHQRAIHCLTIHDLVWCEIDNLEHLQRAKEICVPFC